MKQAFRCLALALMATSSVAAQDSATKAPAVAPAATTPAATTPAATPEARDHARARFWNVTPSQGELAPVSPAIRDEAPSVAPGARSTYRKVASGTHTIAFGAGDSTPFGFGTADYTVFSRPMIMAEQLGAPATRYMLDSFFTPPEGHIAYRVVVLDAGLRPLEFQPAPGAPAVRLESFSATNWSEVPRSLFSPRISHSGGSETVDAAIAQAGRGYTLVIENMDGLKVEWIDEGPGGKRPPNVRVSSDGRFTASDEALPVTGGLKERAPRRPGTAP
ncbi:MAG: hypothetical protein SF028_09395 [Candidatus Sumerlaeia bacterium]|nr:hypothetical protein [Candidatus Sumerlaeia bacterium]